jgi:hypothetical protein
MRRIAHQKLDELHTGSANDCIGHDLVPVGQVSNLSRKVSGCFDDCRMTGWKPVLQ